MYSCNYNYNDDLSKTLSSTRSLDEHKSLYSSERLEHHQLPKLDTKNDEFSATQVFNNLTSSLDGLFSKIEAIKEVHVVEQTNPKSSSRK